MWGIVSENGSCTGLSDKIIHKLVDFAAGWYFLSPINSRFLDFTQPYFFVPFVIVVPPGDEEKFNLHSRLGHFQLLPLSATVNSGKNWKCPGLVYTEKYLQILLKSFIFP